MTGINRREFLSGAAGAGLAAAGARSRPPNIVWIMQDDTGYADLGCYGQKLIRTPNIDRLASEGKRFTAAYAGCTVCAPSRSTLMTGLHAGHTPVRSNTGGVYLHDTDFTVAKMLHGAGYRTGVFGKWGLGDFGTPGVPAKQGFDEFFGYLHQVHAHSYFPEFLWKNEEKYPLPGNRDHKKEQYSPDLVLKETLRFIRENKDRPFFLYSTPTLTHMNYEVPNDAPYSGKDWPPVEKNYAAMVGRADAAVGAIMKSLGELGLDDNTIVFFTSDNGAAPARARFFGSTGPFRGGKANLYEGGLRVPMIARWRGRIQPGSTSDHPWYFCDFLPTAAELAGVKAPKGIDGLSVLPALLGKKQPRHEFMYWEWQQYAWETLAPTVGRGLQRAVRMGDWKAYLPEKGPLELYNLAEDVGEKNNVAGREPAIIRRIEQYLKSARTEPRAQPEPARPPGPFYSHGI